jgi:UDP-N-acetyl-D-galactosamine dehydrogenase
MNNYRIAVIGLGYVGLPLLIEFSKKFKVVGFDINKGRVKELQSGIDHTNEIEVESIKESLNKGFVTFSDSIDDIKDCNFYIVTVPTPIDKFKNPDLSPLISASSMISKILKEGDFVVYESTVYPGVSEEICVPILEKSGLKLNESFFVGYSPERINPGDKTHTVSKIMKITSGSNEYASNIIDNVYGSIILAGTFKAKSIKVAEAAKVIENAQRDINIAFVNELAKIFSKLNIDTNDVLEAAGTKWNFMKFKPGLVGGHCIGVDPYYLAHKALEVGHNPEIILSGRRLNDSMGLYVVDEVVRMMIDKELAIKNSECLVLGFTFKENCPDIRNTKVIDIISNLSSYGINVSVVDPNANKTEVKEEYGIILHNSIEETCKSKFDIVILAVAHSEFLQMDMGSFRDSYAISIVYDVKGVLPSNVVDKRL